MKQKQSESNRELQRNRMRKYFLDSAVEIIDEEGIEHLTIRKVAAKAGYNSATLYNYFENLDNLKLFASMTYLDEYIDNIAEYLKDAKTSFDIYRANWRCFIHYSFQKPAIYYAIFFADLERNLEYYFERYYKAYPLKTENQPPLIQKMLHTNSIEKRSAILVDQCIADGFFTKEDGRFMDNVILDVYETMLNRVNRKKITPERAEEILNHTLTKLTKTFRLPDSQTGRMDSP